jgi:copper chaperone CopZ
VSSGYEQISLNLQINYFFSEVSLFVFSNHSLILLIMKTFKLFVVVLLLMAVGANVQGQTGTKASGPRTESFKVSGACGMCKTRIEKTVKAEGATSAAWDEKTQLVTVTFDPAKTSVDALSKKLAAVGHDTEKYKADDKVYEALPACCHYERGK